MADGSAAVRVRVVVALVGVRVGAVVSAVVSELDRVKLARKEVQDSGLGKRRVSPVRLTFACVRRTGDQGECRNARLYWGFPFVARP